MFFQKKVLVLNPYPQTPFPGKGAILLGLPPLDPVGGYAPATPFLYNQEVYRQSETALRFYTQGGLAIQKFSVMLFASCFISGTSAASQSLILQ